MTVTSTLKPAATALLLLLTVSLAQADQWSGHLGVLAGGKLLDNGDWPELDKHFSMGFISDIKKDSWPMSMALDLIDTGGKSDHDGEEDLGHTTEIHLGARKIFLEQNGRMHPYFGGGLAFMYAEQEYEIGMIKTKEDDSTLGGWFGVGTYYTVNSKFVMGLDVRYSCGEVSLFDENRDSGGLHAYITAGIQL